MSVTCYFGATEHGKSYHVAKNVVSTWNKVVIFDPTDSFQGDVFRSPNEKKFMDIFRKYARLRSYRIVIRTDGHANDEVLSVRTILLALSLGEALGRVGPKNRIQMIVDEAGSICNSHYQPVALKKLVTKGRHFNVDSHFIVQNPMAIHNQIRSQATQICSFFLGNASSVPTFTEKFSREICRKIMNLPKYYRFQWSENGEQAIYNDKNKIIINFPKNSSEFLKLKGV